MFTSLSFKNFVSTVEGEFQVKLGHLLAKEKDKGGMQMQKPTTTILNLVPADDEEYGIRNWNSNKNIMYIICQYVKVEPTDGVCLNPVKPLGHCFPICGAIIDFASNEVKLEDIQSILDAVKTEYQTGNKVVAILERVNDDDLSHDYQISLIPKDPKAVFDEKLYITLSYLIKEKLLKSAANSYSFFGFKIEHSKTDYSFSTSSKVIGSILFFGTLLAILIYYHIKQGTFRRINTRIEFPNLPVAFHRKDDVEVVELIGSEKSQKESEELALDELSNPNFEEVEGFPKGEQETLTNPLSKMESQGNIQDIQSERPADIPMTLLDL